MKEPFSIRMPIMRLFPRTLKILISVLVLFGSEAFREKAEAFLERAKKSRESWYASVGVGSDYRYEDENVLGFALVHLAFFSRDDGEKSREGSSFRD